MSLSLRLAAALCRKELSQVDDLDPHQEASNRVQDEKANVNQRAAFLSALKGLQCADGWRREPRAFLSAFVE